MTPIYEEEVLTTKIYEINVDLTSDTIGPEKELMLSIIRTAIEDLDKKDSLRRSAIEYFKSQDSDYLFSFQNICLFLNVSPSKLRDKLGI
jgi:hypothetical protein